MQPLDADIKRLTSLIDNKFSRGIALGDELPRLRGLLKLQIASAEILGERLPLITAFRYPDAFPVAAPGVNAALLKPGKHSGT